MTLAVVEWSTVSSKTWRHADESKIFGEASLQQVQGCQAQGSCESYLLEPQA